MAYDRGKKKRITVDMSPKMVEFLEEKASDNERNLSQQVRIILKKYYEEETGFAFDDD